MKKRILILGAGKAGQEYAVHLLRAGHDVILYARPSQVPQLMQKGLNYFNSIGEEVFAQISREVIVTELDPQKSFDFIFILFRGDQIQAASELLAPLNKSNTELVMGIPVWSFDHPSFIDNFKACSNMIPKKGNAILKPQFRPRRDSSATTFGQFSDVDISNQCESAFELIRSVQPTVFVKDSQLQFDFTLIVALPLLLALKIHNYSIRALSRDTTLLCKVSAAQNEARDIYKTLKTGDDFKEPFAFRLLFLLPISLRARLFQLLKLVPVVFTLQRVEDHFRTIEGQTLYLTNRLIQPSAVAPHLTELMLTSVGKYSV